MSAVIVRIICWLTLLILETCNSVVIGEIEYESLGATLKSDTPLQQGQGLVSPNGAYALVLRHDGNLVVYSTWNNGNLWSTNTNDGQHLVYESNGNLVLYNSQSPAISIWSSYTKGLFDGSEAGRLVMLDDGYFSIWDNHADAKWHIYEDYAYETVTFPFSPPEPTCNPLDTYSRSMTPATCPTDKVTKAGLCYNKCKSGYSSYTGVDCIEDCPKGYTDEGVICSKQKTCEKCDKVCVLGVCDKVCTPYVCVKVVDKHIYTRTPSWPNQCPPDYQPPNALTAETLCYKSCKKGYVDLGVVCTCDPEQIYSDAKQYAKKFTKFFDIYMKQLLQALNLMNCVDDDSLGKDMMEPFIPAMNEFMNIVNIIVNGPVDEYTNGNKQIIVLEIGCSGAAVISVGVGSFGYVFDPNTDKYYYYEGAYCIGLKSDVGVDVSVSLFLFNHIKGVPGTSQSLSGGVDIKPTDFGVGTMVVFSEMMSQYLASGFSFSLGPNLIPAQVDWHQCETPALKEIK